MGKIQLCALYSGHRLISFQTGSLDLSTKVLEMVANTEPSQVTVLNLDRLSY